MFLLYPLWLHADKIRKIFSAEVLREQAIPFPEL